MSFKLYRVEEGGSFGNLESARADAQDRANRRGKPFVIVEYTFDMRPLELALAILNHTHWWTSRSTILVVKPKPLNRRVSKTAKAGRLSILSNKKSLTIDEAVELHNLKATGAT